MHEATPDAELAGDLFWGIFKPQLIRIALVLDVFTPLGVGPATAEEVAQRCACDPAGTCALLDYLSALGLLDRHDGRYSLTSTAATLLVRGRPAYIGDMILDYTDAAMYASITESIRTGRPRSLAENFAQDAWLDSYSRTRVASSLEMWASAGVGVGSDEPLRVLDLACGCAIKSLALAQASPNVHVTCVDAAVVLEAAADLADRLGVSSRVTLLPADLFTVDLGTSCFDAVLIGQITHYLTGEQNRGLFARVHAALADRGMLVIDCPMTQEVPTETAAFLSLFLWANSGGSAHSFATYADWLTAAGFRSARQLGERWLAADR